MQSYDIAMIAVLAAATLWGFFRGMARQVASLAAIVGGYPLALRFSPALAKHIAQPEPLNRFLSMLLIYLATLLAVWLVYRRVARIIERVELKDFDRQVGAFFGAAKGALLCVAITFGAVSLSAASRDTVLASKSGFYIARLMHEAGPLMPKELHAVLDPYLIPFERQLTSDGSPRKLEENSGIRPRQFPFVRDFGAPR